MILTMADTAEPTILASALAPSPGQKRKRVEQTSPGDRRSKRGAPTATMTPSADPTAFIENAVEAAQAAAAASGVNVADFNALQQAAADHPETTDAVTATSTAAAAAAALGSLYPTLHVPQPTEETFNATNPPERDDSEDLSLLRDGSQSHGAPTDASLGSLAAPTNGIRAPDSRYPPPPASAGSQSTPTHKPTVGSEEWHKMRKDNHKEGE